VAALQRVPVFVFKVLSQMAECYSLVNADAPDGNRLNVTMLKELKYFLSPDNDSHLQALLSHYYRLQINRKLVGSYQLPPNIPAFTAL
jgi:hypothetical protein